jgi:hypothetical protein
MESLRESAAEKGIDAYARAELITVPQPQVN